MSDTLIILGSSNTPGKKDYTGAFLPEANAYQKVHGAARDIIHFDNQLPFAKRYADLSKKLHDEAAPFYERVVIFCHGWADGIQAGLTRKNVSRFLTEFEEFYLDYCCFVLYCCSTGGDDDDDAEQAAGTEVVTYADANLGEGSFADTLRDELCKHGARQCKVVAHRTAGHATQNPNVIVFEGNDSPIGGVGGYLPISLTRDKKLWRAWARMLKTDFRFKYPFMTIAEIHEAVMKEATKK